MIAASRTASLQRATILGLGEAGSEIARDLLRAGVQVRGYDPDNKPHYNILSLYRRELVVHKAHSGADELAFKVYTPGTDTHTIVPVEPCPATFLGDLVALSASTQEQRQPGAPR